MRRNIFAILATMTIVIGGPGASPGQAAAPDEIYTSNRDIATYYDWSGTTPVQVWLSRYESRSGNPYRWSFDGVYLDYRIGSEYGYGSIPASSVTGTWSTGLSLHVDTSTLSPDTFTVGGTGGVIHFTWERTNQWRSSWSGVREHSYTSATRTYRIQMRGASTTFSASASGTILGTAVSGGQAEVGQNHQLQFTFYVE